MHLIGGERLLLLGGVHVEAGLQRFFSTSSGSSCSFLLWLLLLLSLSSADPWPLLSWSMRSLVLLSLLVASSLDLLPLSRFLSVAGDKSLTPLTCTYEAASAAGDREQERGAAYLGLPLAAPSSS